MTGTVTGAEGGGGLLACRGVVKFRAWCVINYCACAAKSRYLLCRPFTTGHLCSKTAKGRLHNLPQQLVSTELLPRTLN